MDTQEPHKSPPPPPPSSAGSPAPEIDDREIRGAKDRLNEAQGNEAQLDEAQPKEAGPGEARPTDPRPKETQPNEAEPSELQPEHGTHSTAGKPVVEAIRRAWSSTRVRIVVAAVVLVAGCIALTVSWWKASPPPPTDLLAPPTEASGEDAPDVEQQAFRQRQERLSAQPTIEAELDRDAGQSAVDLEWIERLAGRWRLDFGHRAASVVFGATPAKVLDVGAMQLTLYPVSGRGLPSYFTVLKRSEGDSFLAFQNELGEYEGLLDDLQFHGRDLFSYRIGGTSHRGYGHREGRIGRRPEARFGAPGLEPFPEQEEDLPVAPEPIHITVERQPLHKLWSRAESLKDSGRYDSLEIALERVLVSHPSHGKAERWSRNLPKWRAKQRRTLQGQLNRHLKRLQNAVGKQDLDGVLDLWHSGARPAGRGFFRSFFDRFERTKLRYQLKRSEVDDGTLIFDVTLTFEGSDGRQRSLETRPWRGRLVDKYFLDPFPGR